MVSLSFTLRYNVTEGKAPFSMPISFSLPGRRSLVPTTAIIIFPETSRTTIWRRNPVRAASVVRNHAAFRAVSGKKSDDLPRPRGLNGAVPDRHDAVRVDRVKAERPALPRGELQFVAVTIGFSPRDRALPPESPERRLAGAIFHIGALIRALGRIIHVLKLTSRRTCRTPGRRALCGREKVLKLPAACRTQSPFSPSPRGSGFLPPEGQTE